MLKKIFFALFAVALCQALTQAQQPVNQNFYENLLDRVKKQDPTVNFTDLRMAYTETKDYSPYGDAENRKAMFMALNAREYEKALTESDKILALNYVDLNAHFVAFVAHRQLGHADKSEYHQSIFKRLMQSIEGSGDGTTPKTAFAVISTDEEYVWFNYKGMKVTSQALINDGGHSFDKMTATDRETGETVVTFFNIDKPFNWLGNSLKQKAGETQSARPDY